MLVNVSSEFKTNFDLKKSEVTVSKNVRSAKMSLQQLEAFRTDGKSVSASKTGLEVICGASCETGAQ